MTLKVFNINIHDNKTPKIMIAVWKSLMIDYVKYNVYEATYSNSSFAVCSGIFRNNS